MLQASDIPELSAERVIELVRDGVKHPYYDRVLKRSRMMNAWYGANESLIGDNILKTEIIRKSPIESQKDYQYRLDNFDLIPFEHKFLQGQQRIYDDNNVSRSHESEFWSNKEKHFDDCGDEVDTFFRDKVLYVKEVEGFGGIAFDFATGPDGQAISVEGGAVPYPYIVQASELRYFEHYYGQLQVVSTCIKKGNREEWRVFTPNNIYFFRDKESEPEVIPHPFGEVPFIIVKGAADPSSGFKVGLPRRWNVTSLYLTACELLYDLKLGSMYFGHPIPYMHIDDVKSMAGVLDEDDKLVANAVKNEVGMIGIYEGEEPPKDLFMQASMEGLQHLTSVIFESIIPLIYQSAQTRDKSQIVHNASGRSKQFDSVEEQALLSQTATDMEAIEKEVFRLMYKARGDESEPVIVYSKHHDLRTADEVWKQFTEGLQYAKDADGFIHIPKSVLTYQLMEYARKVSAPKEVQSSLESELNDFYSAQEGEQE